MAGSLMGQTAQIRRAPTLNGRVEGSIQQMTAENVTLNGGAEVTGDLLVPGSPTIRLNGNPTYAGTLEGAGAATPTAYTITLNGNAKLGHVVRRSDAVALPAVAAPPAPTGTRSVSLNNAGQSPGDFATLKNLTLNGGVGAVTVPPGTYGNFTANANSGFVLGVAGATTPAVYHFQNLTLNGNSTFQVIGPVIVTVKNGVSANSGMGTATHPEWLTLRIANGGLTLNGNVSIYAQVEAPAGTVTINGNSQLIGALSANRLTVNGNGLVRLIAPAVPNQSPVITLTAPVDGSNLLAPTALTLRASAADSDGTVARVEFYQGATKLGEDTSAPYEFTTGNLAAGTYQFSARAVDNLGAVANSPAATVTVTAANQVPTVALTSPIAGASYTAPATIALAATASDPDGFIAKVEFYSGAAKLGDDATAPYEFTATGLTAGTYTFTAQAIDQQGATAASALVTVSVGNPNQAPTVTLAEPLEGASFTAPAAFTLNATATDSDGTIAKVEFFQGSTKLGEDTTTPYEFAVTGLAAGFYSYRARVTDNAGLSADSVERTVAVTAPNVPPVVILTSPMEGASFTAPATIVLTAEATDTNGTVTKVEFFNGPTKLGEDLVAPYEFSWSGVAVGSYTLTAVVTDNAGASTTSLPRVVTVAVDHGVPFLAGFEASEGYQPGPLHGQNGWVVLGSAEVVPSPVASGQQAVSVAPATTVSLVGRVFTNTDSRVTFVDLYAQPAAATTPEYGVFFETDVVRVALTRSGEQGVLRAFSGDGVNSGTWLTTPYGPTLDTTGHTTNWLRLTARSDYTTKLWDLYANDRMIAADVGFLSPTPTAFTSLGLSGHATLTTGFDDVLVTFDNPLFVDADHDGMEDAWETAHGLDITINDRSADLDGDGLANIQEYLLDTLPNTADTDGDGLSDSQERTLGTNPKSTDSDGDGLPDGWEKSHNLNPLAATDATLDTDGDGQSSLAEYHSGTDPTDYFNGQLPIFTSLVAADGSLGPGDTLSLLVTNAAGQPLANAPVTFTAETGGHLLAATATEVAVVEVMVRTGSNGIATVYVKKGVN